MEIDQILSLPPSPRRTALLASWLQSLYTKDPPILVGGAAVEIYSQGAYTTGDLDFVGFVPSSVEEQLAAAGFERHGRHWIHEAGIYLEFPGSSLEEHEKAVTFETEGAAILILSPEDLLVDRLAHWQFWGSGIDAVNALRIVYRWKDDLDHKRLRQAAKHRQVSEALDVLERTIDAFGPTLPDSEELDRWLESDPLTTT